MELFRRTPWDKNGELLTILYVSLSEAVMRHSHVYLGSWFLKTVQS